MNQINEITENDLQVLDKITPSKRFSHYFPGKETRMLIPFKSAERHIPNEAKKWFQLIFQDGWNFSKKVPNIMERTEEKEHEGKKFISKKEVRIGLLLKKYGGEKAEEWWNKNSKSFSSGEKLSIIFSINPMDILRVGDVGKHKAHRGETEWRSCLSPGGLYWNNAIVEAANGGGVCFLVRSSDIENEDLRDDDLFEDPDRDNFSANKVEVLGRLRIRRALNKTNAIELAVPEKKMYGPRNDQFVDSVVHFFKDTQFYKIAGCDRNDKWILSGGEYEDNPLSSLLTVLGIRGIARYEYDKNSSNQYSQQHDVFDEEFRDMWTGHERYRREIIDLSADTGDIDIILSHDPPSHRNGEWSVLIHIKIAFKIFGYHLSQQDRLNLDCVYEKFNIPEEFSDPISCTFIPVTNKNDKHWTNVYTEVLLKHSGNFMSPDDVQNMIDGIDDGRTRINRYDSFGFFEHLRRDNKDIFEKYIDQEKNLIQRIERNDLNGLIELYVNEKALAGIPIYADFIKFISVQDDFSLTKIYDEIYDRTTEHYENAYGTAGPIGSREHIAKATVLIPENKRYNIYFSFTDILQTFYSCNLNNFPILKDEEWVRVVQSGIASVIPDILKQIMEEFSSETDDQESLQEISQKVLDAHGIVPNQEDGRFDHIFGEKKRISFKYSGSKTVDELFSIIQKLERFGYRIPLNDFGYAYKTVVSDHNGERRTAERKLKIGPLIQSLGENEKNWWIKNATFFSTDSNKNFLYEFAKSEKPVIIASRSPIDIVRMSDHEEWTSCHGEHGGYFQSAVNEAKVGGIIFYAVREHDFQKYKANLQNDDFFKDKDRRIDGPSPMCRVRARSFLNKDEAFRILVPEKRMYGQNLPEFLKQVSAFLHEKQNKIIDQIKNHANMKIDDFHLEGGTYEDTSASILFDSFLGSNIISGANSLMKQYEDELRRKANQINDEHTTVEYDLIESDEGNDVYISGNLTQTFSLDGYFLPREIEERKFHNNIVLHFEEQILPQRSQWHGGRTISDIAKYDLRFDDNNMFTVVFEVNTDQQYLYHPDDLIQWWDVIVDTTEYIPTHAIDEAWIATIREQLDDSFYINALVSFYGDYIDNNNLDFRIKHCTDFPYNCINYSQNDRFMQVIDGFFQYLDSIDFKEKRSDFLNLTRDNSHKLSYAIAERIFRKIFYEKGEIGDSIQKTIYALFISKIKDRLASEDKEISDRLLSWLDSNSCPFNISLENISYKKVAEKDSHNSAIDFSLNLNTTTKQEIVENSDLLYIFLQASDQIIFDFATDIKNMIEKEEKNISKKECGEIFYILFGNEYGYSGSKLFVPLAHYVDSIDNASSE